MEKLTLAKSVLKEIQTTANAVAREFGQGMATDLVPGEKLEVVDYTTYGYRKYSDDSYVSNAYRDNFGWKNTYYQNSLTTVSLPPELWAKKEKWEKYIEKHK